MTVSEKLGAALSARQWWCRPGEPILWAMWEGKRAYQVEGLDEDGNPAKGMGARFSQATGRAALAAGVAVVDGALTVAFGEGDRGDPQRPESEPPPPDLTIIGPRRDCSAVRLFSSRCPEGFEVATTLWVLTPSRLGVLVPRERAVEEPKSDGLSGNIRQLGRGLGGVGRSLMGSTVEEFGENEPEKPLNKEVTAWFELTWSDIVGGQIVGDEGRHCALTLGDGSGFVLNAGAAPDASAMVEAGNRWRSGG